jgi:tetratricopeptide (TPR) repeat protein
LILQAAIEANPQDARAPYYLGNFLYAHRRHEQAIVCWEKSATLDPNFATVQRNLGLAYYNQQGDTLKALQCYQNAFALNSIDARVFFELDQLYKRLNLPPAKRFALLQEHPELIAQRDDLTIEYITLLNLLGRHMEALQALMAGISSGKEVGKVTGHMLCLEMASC